jgi:Domain of unknown function (DUF4397)
VKTLNGWTIIGSAVLGIALSACGGSSDSSGDTVSVRLINATLTHPSLDLLVGGTTSISATAVDTVSGYITPAAGANTLQVANAGTTAALATIVPSLGAGSAYALLSYESGGTVKMAVLNESVAAPSSGAATLRIYNAAVEAGKLDVYVLASGTCSDLSAFTANTNFGVLSAPAAVTITSSPGDYHVCVTGGGNKSDVRLDIPVLTLGNQQVVYVVLTPASGGQLLDGATMVQQGAYAASRNTNTRVRLAAAVSGGASVSASASSGAGVVVIDSGSVAPAFGYYTLVPASSTLNINVIGGGGGTVGAPATALKPGADMTLLVYGPAAGATASLLTDDNRAPDSGSVKLRLLNGITTSPGALTFTANNAPVATNVLPGTASGYVSVSMPASGNTFSLGLNSSATGGAYYSTSTQLNGGTVYTVLAADATSPPPAQLLIR